MFTPSRTPSRQKMIEPAFPPNDSPFDVMEPAVSSVPFVFNSPHSGRRYPAAFLESSRLNEQTIRRSEDLFVDELFDDMPLLGAPLLRANFPRAFLDVNREPYELDPKMFEGTLPSYANIRSIRVAGGLGTIARLVSESQEIYRHRLPVEDALRRIDQLYKPYHQELRSLIANVHQRHQVAYLIDCHSMPSGDPSIEGKCRPDFVIGDRYGTSCTSDLSDHLVNCLKKRGYEVTRNKPYAGGFITEHYGRPDTGLHALQVEINRGLYANEENLTKKAYFARLKQDLNDVMAEVMTSWHTWNGTAPYSTPIAAE